jgi:hypothetical protein
VINRPHHHAGSRGKQAQCTHLIWEYVCCPVSQQREQSSSLLENDDELEARYKCMRLLKQEIGALQYSLREVRGRLTHRCARSSVVVSKIPRLHVHVHAGVP